MRGTADAGRNRAAAGRDRTAARRRSTPAIAAVRRRAAAGGVVRPSVALAVGNSDYRYAPKLANPTNDETDFAGALRRLGFDMVAGTNLDRHGMDDAIREFGRKHLVADIAVRSRGNITNRIQSATPARR
jgi:hypothetical protein